MYLKRTIIDDLKKVDNNILKLTDFRIFSYPSKDKHIYAICIFEHQETGIQYTQIIYMENSKSLVFGEELVTHGELGRRKGPSF